MKKIISIFISSMLIYFPGYCQLMENGDHEKSVMRLKGNASQFPGSNADLSVLITPNPSTGKFTIKLNKSIVNGKIMIQNIEGKLIENLIVNGLSATIDLSSFPSGIYVVRVISGKQVSTQQIVKQ